MVKKVEVKKVAKVVVPAEPTLNKRAIISEDGKRKESKPIGE